MHKKHQADLTLQNKHLKNQYNIKSHAQIEAEKVGTDKEGRTLWLVVRYTQKGLTKDVSSFEMTHDKEGAILRLSGSGVTEEAPKEKLNLAGDLEDIKAL